MSTGSEGKQQSKTLAVTGAWDLGSQEQPQLEHAEQETHTVRGNCQARTVILPWLANLATPVLPWETRPCPLSSMAPGQCSVERGTCWPTNLHIHLQVGHWREGRAFLGADPLHRLHRPPPPGAPGELGTALRVEQTGPELLRNLSPSKI